jgi:hypothetical protein
MKKEFITAISSGNYIDAKNMFNTLATKEKTEFLTELVLETNLIGLYTFVMLLLLEKENETIHEYAINILLVSLWNGANAAAFLHARRVAELLPNNVSKKQNLLFYFGIPDCSMTSIEAKQLALEILRADPTNAVAHETLGQIAAAEKRELC